MFGAGLGKYQIFSARGAAVGERGFVEKVTLITHSLSVRGAEVGRSHHSGKGRSWPCRQLISAVELDISW